MSTSTGKTISLPTINTINEVEGYKTTEVLINFLRDQDIGLDNDDFNILREQKIDAKKISKLIEKIKGEGQELKKRKVEEELKITAPKKRKWMVNSAIMQEEHPIVYFVDSTEQNAPLLESVHRGEFVALHGSRASGKSTRLFAKLTQNVIKLQPSFSQLSVVLSFPLYSASFEHVSINNVDLFWQTLGMILQRNAPELFGPLKNLQIKFANDFLNTFHKTQWKSLDAVILFDEFDMLYNAMDDVLASCLTTLRGIKASKQDYTIRSIIVIGPFSIMHLNSNNLTTLLYNINEPFQNLNFTLEQVQFIYKEFANEYELTIDQEVIKDIYIQTNRHAGLVCLCECVIYRKLLPEIGLHLSYNLWQHFVTFLLENAILEYPMFMRMKDALLNENSVDAIKLFRSDFLANFDPILVTGNKRNLALFLIAERQIIPHVFLTSSKVDVPYHPLMGTLDIFEVLKQVIRVFDREIIKSRNSFKLARVLVSNANNREVPRESMYDAELYQIISNWLYRFTVMGQWHLKYRAATPTKKELKEYYERALLYDKKLPADETWVVNFTCCEDTISEPYWPTESQLQKGLRVIYFWHNLDFTKISVIACWLDTNNNTRHVTDVSQKLEL
ncbi:24608_t:CDS:2 [Gigaspora margarita]|uniref:24608_t:CDS:1 n=1 Tax=Gigaspora margarita TaxID=4874 RepID=A0ABN7VNK9_GIGMA|nr:24608_t:CDS:2 [Gigaspora margarita]